ncbi:hypothetical protein BRCH_01168c [Candidatus Burkholderia brachyanthoides]|nr:hypothetical protein BRCH_01168c [Candidatus Burkholderia brachyanthoides]
MMRKAVLAVSAISVLLAGPVLASDWRLVTSNDAFDLYADAESITSGPTIKVWMRFDGKPPYKVENGLLQVRGMERWNIDCMNRTVAMSDYAGYDDTGQAVISKPDPQTPPHPIAPDSV